MPSIELLIAFTAAAGLAVGSLVHVAATAFGLYAVFAHSPTLYMIIKLMGAAYLIYAGLTCWISKGSDGGEQVRRPREKPLSSVFQQSVIVEATNPKTALFFLALLPQFAVPESGPVSQQLLILAVIVTISALSCGILVAVSSSKISNWLLRHERAQQIQDRISGAILFAMGAYIVSDEIIASKV